MTNWKGIGIYAGIIGGLFMIPIGLGFYFWYYEPITNPNNLLEKFANATDYELVERRIVSLQINELQIQDNKVVYCGSSDVVSSRCIELNMTNPISYVGKHTTLQIDELRPICHEFNVWENGTTTDVGVLENFFLRNDCNWRTVANLPNDNALQLSQQSDDNEIPNVANVDQENKSLQNITPKESSKE